MFGAGIKSSYSITNANGHEIAKSEKTEWFNAKIRIIDRSGNLIAEISRATSVFSHALDRWKIKIINRSAFDSRIAVMIVAYKAAADLEREAESESDSD